MVSLKKKKKKILAGTVVLIMTITGIKVVGNIISSPAVTQAQEMPDLDNLDMGELFEDVQIEPVRTRNDNCIFNRDTSMYLGDDLSSKVLRNVNFN